MTATNTSEWNAGVYHRVSNPHVDWGLSVLDGLELLGHERVADLGCGSGRVTAELLERLPTGEAVAVDRSANMIEEARAHLEPRFGDRIRFVQADLLTIQPTDIGGPVDLVFSTATFHWIRDHDMLFARLFALLKPGGRLVAQCGGGPNLQRHVDRAEAMMNSEPWRPFFVEWDAPRFGVDEKATAERLRRAGFVGIETSLIPAPTTLDDAQTFFTFMTNVVFREHLMQLPDPLLQDSFVEELARLAASDGPPFSLDYWRLNMRGRRPLE
jgi:trans-aconitate 2-methyltransferase